MTAKDTITLPREVVEHLTKMLEECPLIPNADWSERDCDALNALRTALAAEQPKPNEDVEALRRDAFRKGFYAGFAATGEGWNGEYPFQDKNRPIAGDPSVEAAIDAAMEGKT